jgi:cytochrome c556
MLEGDITFNVAVARSVFRTMNAAAYALGDFFPEGSNVGETRARPEIWENRAAFEAIIAAFQERTDAALEADPQDLASFQAQFDIVRQTCGECHGQIRTD